MTKARKVWQFIIPCCIVIWLTFIFLPQLTNGELHFRYSCGSASSGSLLVKSDSVSDGHWHHALLEVTSTTLRLTLDQHHPASTVLTEPCRMMRSHGALLFASLPQDSTLEAQRHPRRFIGCLEGLEFSGQPIRVGDMADWTGPGSRKVFGEYQCCSRAGPCDKNPCQSGGVCMEDPNGG